MRLLPLRLAALLGLALTFTLLAPGAFAQKLSKSWTEVPEHGFKFKALDGYDQLPPGGREDPDTVLRFEDGRNEVTVYAFENVAAVSDDGEKPKDEEEGRRRQRRKKKRELMPLLELKPGLGALEGVPTFEERVEIDGLNVRHMRFEWEREEVYTDGSTKVIPRFIEVWTYPLTHADIHIVYFAFEEFDRRWGQTIERSAETFEQIDRIVPEEIDTSALDFDSQLAWAEQQAAKTPGWRAVPTESKRFVILTNVEKDTFIKDVIARLEVSRDVYEKDFPPPADFDAVSIVRICSNEQEFLQFSKAPRGTAGYFSPFTVELVLYDDVAKDRNVSYAVMSHEAFHQYCHFLFNQSEAHRWFDEGHGDYYGGMDIRGKRAKITPKMPAGLDRLSVIRQLVREEKTVPLEEHLNYSHLEWQKHSVKSYAQSWSIIYMLRQGALGKVSKRYWKDAYANIIPNYVTTLNAGFEEAYAEIIAEREKIAKEKFGRELKPEERKVDRRVLDPRAKEEIWKKAMDASWGQIDLEEFEQNWLAYVEKGLR